MEFGRTNGAGHPAFTMCRVETPIADCHTSRIVDDTLRVPSPRPRRRALVNITFSTSTI